MVFWCVFWCRVNIVWFLHTLKGHAQYALRDCGMYLWEIIMKLNVSCLSIIQLIALHVFLNKENSESLWYGFICAYVLVVFSLTLLKKKPIYHFTI